MNKIEIIIVSGGYLIVELNGAYLEMWDSHFSLLRKKMMRVITATPGFQTIRGISAWGGIVPHMPNNPAQSLEQIICFREIILHETDKNTCNRYFVDKIRPILSFLLWQNSEHFQPLGSARRMFQCLVCGNVQRGEDIDAVIGGSFHILPPHICASGECYSHKIPAMFNQD